MGADEDIIGRVRGKLDPQSLGKAEPWNRETGGREKGQNDKPERKRNG